MIKFLISDLKVLLEDAWDARTMWYNLGLELECNSHDLDAIKRNNRDVESCFREMLKTRLSNSTPLQWSHLINALRRKHINFKLLANDLAKKYEAGMVLQLSARNNDSEANQTCPQNQGVNVEGKIKQLLK